MEEVKKQETESLFVPYKIALELKELGFDEHCFGYFYTEDKFFETKIKNSELEEECSISAPTFSQAFRWFREKYDLVIEPCVPFQRLYSTEEDHFEILEFGYRIYSFDQYRGGLRDKIEWDGYDNSNEEEAELECLKKLIEIVTNKN